MARSASRSGKDGDAQVSSPAERAEIRELSLEEVLESYEQPSNEEQAWAVCFICGDLLLWCYGTFWHSPSPSTQHAPFLHHTCAQLVQSMGAVIYRALDWGLDDSEERELSPQLEQLIEFMVGSSESKHCGSNAAKDEGYSGQDEDEEEEEEGAVHGFHTVHQVMALCARRLANPALAPEHYYGCNDGDVCLVPQARLWVQLMKELRQGVKLKKVEEQPFNPLPTEFSLTPFEMLMQDIRSHKYKLRKVVVDGNIPTCVKRNAHELILDFMRSRPPLKPVSASQYLITTVLPPHDRVLAEVRQDHKLRPVEPSSSERSFGSFPCLVHTCQCDIKSTSCINLSITGAGSRPLSRTRVLLKAPTLAEMEEMSMRVESSPTPLKRDRSFFEHHLDELRGEVMSESWPLTGERPRSHMLMGVGRLSRSRSDLRPNGPKQSKMLAYIIVNKDPRLLLCLPHSQEEFIINARRILIKAEMEKYMQNKELYNNLKKGKICCCCQVKFPLFSWPSTCLLCKRSVCSSCSAKKMLKVCLFVCRSLCSLSRHSVEEAFPHLYAAGCNLRDMCSDCTKFVADVISSSRRSLDIINNTPKCN
uniref:Spire-type actin nucleation factor 2 n=1 Tax=Sinocyclocheilus grahami TaxID=75366 RepID=A0A672RWL9_SINGR